MNRLNRLVLALLVLLSAHALAEDTDPAKILEKVSATYKSMQTYKAQGTVLMDMDMDGTKVSMKTSFSIALKKPNQYLVSWTQENKAMPGMPAQTGAVWSGGTQPYLYMGMMNAYSKIEGDATALGAATGISGGAAFTIPSLFLSAFEEQPAAFSRLVEPKLEGAEKIGDRDCYVISGPSAVSKRETLWISKEGHLLVKSSRSLEPPEEGVVIPEMTDEDLAEAIKAMGQEVTEESKQKMRDMMKMSRELVKKAKMKGTMTELHTGVSSPELQAADFDFTVPEGTELKDSLFGGMLGGAGTE
jgi:Predicted periplasmic protein (DUF2092)